MARILVVDDEPGILRFTRRALESEGHVVLTAGDGTEGLRLATEHDPDLVERTQAWLDSAPREPALRRLLVEARDGVARAVRVQARDAG